MVNSSVKNVTGTIRVEEWAFVYQRKAREEQWADGLDTRLEKLWLTGTHLHSRAATVGNCLAGGAFAILTAAAGVLLHLCFPIHSVEVHRRWSCRALL